MGNYIRINKYSTGTISQVDFPNLETSGIGSRQIGNQDITGIVFLYVIVG